MLSALFTCQHMFFSLLNDSGCLQPTFIIRTSGTNLVTSKPYFFLCLSLWISVPPVVNRVNIIFQIRRKSCDDSVNIVIRSGAVKPIFGFNLRTNSLQHSPSSEANSS
jgi:hypothetical protein